MSRGRRGPLLIGLGLAALLAGPEVRAERFRLLAANDAASLQRRLEAAAADGYRFRAVAQGLTVSGKPRIAVLVEHAAGDAPAYRYRALACASLLDAEITAELERAGAEGFALVPGGVTTRRLRETWLPGTAYDDQMTLILERGPDAVARFFDAVAFADFEPLYRDLRARRKRGFEVAGLWSGGRRLQVVLQKPVDATAPASVPRYRLLMFAMRQALRSKLARSAREGYRALAAVDPPTPGPPVMLLEKSTGPGKDIEYRFLDKVPERQSKEKLEHKLARVARKRWRVSRRATTHEVMILERAIKKKQRPEEVRYRLLSSRVAPGLPEQLERALAEGYEFVRLFVEPDETTALIERVVP